MTTITGVRIDAGVDEKIQHVHLDGRNLLHALYDTLSCDTIETAALRGGLDAIFDEEGKIRGAEPNHHATTVALLLGARFLPGDYLAGPVIFLGVTEDGDHVAPTPTQHRAILRAIVVARA
ncbi:MULTISPECIES: DUF3846 domain-containing protein [Microbacterium]|uniref:DUF3846 domain-containing protein n=1 Tax=Microbacterium TaxID=33882 RepID=UPI0032F0021A